MLQTWLEGPGFVSDVRNGMLGNPRTEKDDTERPAAPPAAQQWKQQWKQAPKSQTVLLRRACLQEPGPAAGPDEPFDRFPLQPGAPLLRWLRPRRGAPGARLLMPETLVFSESGRRQLFATDPRTGCITCDTHPGAGWRTRFARACAHGSRSGGARAEPPRAPRAPHAPRAARAAPPTPAEAAGATATVVQEEAPAPVSFADVAAVHKVADLQAGGRGWTSTGVGAPAACSFAAAHSRAVLASGLLGALNEAPTNCVLQRFVPSRGNRAVAYRVVHSWNPKTNCPNAPVAFSLSNDCRVGSLAEAEAEAEVETAARARRAAAAAAHAGQQAQHDAGRPAPVAAGSGADASSAGGADASSAAAGANPSRDRSPACPPATGAGADAARSADAEECSDVDSDDSGDSSSSSSGSDAAETAAWLAPAASAGALTATEHRQLAQRTKDATHACLASLAAQLQAVDAPPPGANAGSSSVYVVRGATIAGASEALSSLTAHLQKVAHVGFRMIAADFVRGVDGRWWFLQVKAFVLAPPSLARMLGTVQRQQMRGDGFGGMSDEGDEEREVPVSSSARANKRVAAAVAAAADGEPCGAAAGAGGQRCEMCGCAFLLLAAGRSTIKAGSAGGDALPTPMYNRPSARGCDVEDGGAVGLNATFQAQLRRRGIRLRGDEVATAVASPPGFSPGGSAGGRARKVPQLPSALASEATTAQQEIGYQITHAMASRMLASLRSHSVASHTAVPAQGEPMALHAAAADGAVGLAVEGGGGALPLCYRAAAATLQRLSSGDQTTLGTSRALLVCRRCRDLSVALQQLEEAEQCIADALAGRRLCEPPDTVLPTTAVSLSVSANAAAAAAKAAAMARRDAGPDRRASDVVQAHGASVDDEARAPHICCPASQPFTLTSSFAASRRAAAGSSIECLDEHPLALLPVRPLTAEARPASAGASAMRRSSVAGVNRTLVTSATTAALRSPEAGASEARSARSIDASELRALSQSRRYRFFLFFHDIALEVRDDSNSDAGSDMSEAAAGAASAGRLGQVLEEDEGADGAEDEEGAGGSQHEAGRSAVGAATADGAGPAADGTFSVSLELEYFVGPRRCTVPVAAALDAAAASAAAAVAAAAGLDPVVGGAADHADIRNLRAQTLFGSGKALRGFCLRSSVAVTVYACVRGGKGAPAGGRRVALGEASFSLASFAHATKNGDDDRTTFSSPVCAHAGPRADLHRAHPSAGAALDAFLRVRLPSIVGAAPEHVAPAVAMRNMRRRKQRGPVSPPQLMLRVSIGFMHDDTFAMPPDLRSPFYQLEHVRIDRPAHRHRTPHTLAQAGSAMSRSVRSDASSPHSPAFDMMGQCGAGIGGGLSAMETDHSLRAVFMPPCGYYSDVLLPDQWLGHRRRVGSAAGSSAWGGRSSRASVALTHRSRASVALHLSRMGALDEGGEDGYTASTRAVLQVLFERRASKARFAAARGSVMSRWASAAQFSSCAASASSGSGGAAQAAAGGLAAPVPLRPGQPTAAATAAADARAGGPRFRHPAGDVAVYRGSGLSACAAGYAPALGSGLGLGAAAGSMHCTDGASWGLESVPWETVLHCFAPAGAVRRRGFFGDAAVGVAAMLAALRAPAAERHAAAEEAELQGTRRLLHPCAIAALIEVEVRAKPAGTAVQTAVQLFARAPHSSQPAPLTNDSSMSGAQLFGVLRQALAPSGAGGGSFGGDLPACSTQLAVRLWRECLWPGVRAQAPSGSAVWLGSWAASQSLRQLRKRLRTYNWVWESVDLSEPHGAAEVAEVASFLRCTAGMVPKGEVQRRRMSAEALMSASGGGGSFSSMLANAGSLVSVTSSAAEVEAMFCAALNSARVRRMLLIRHARANDEADDDGAMSEKHDKWGAMAHAAHLAETQKDGDPIPMLTFDRFCAVMEAAHVEEGIESAQMIVGTSDGVAGWAGAHTSVALGAGAAVMAGASGSSARAARMSLSSKLLKIRNVPPAAAVGRRRGEAAIITGSAARSLDAAASSPTEEQRLDAAARQWVESLTTALVQGTQDGAAVQARVDAEEHMDIRAQMLSVFSSSEEDEEEVDEEGRGEQEEGEPHAATAAGVAGTDATRCGGEAGTAGELSNDGGAVSATMSEARASPHGELSRRADDGAAVAEVGSSDQPAAGPAEASCAPQLGQVAATAMVATTELVAVEKPASALEQQGQQEQQEQQQQQQQPQPPPPRQRRRRRGQRKQPSSSAGRGWAVGGSSLGAREELAGGLDTVDKRARKARHRQSQALQAAACSGSSVAVGAVAGGAASQAPAREQGEERCDTRRSALNVAERKTMRAVRAHHGESKPGRRSKRVPPGQPVAVPRAPGKPLRALFNAVIRNNRAEAKMLLAIEHLDVNKRLSAVAGRSALHVAAECGHGAMIELLLAQGALPSLLLGDDDGFTPAQLALVRGHQQAARLLLQAAAAGAQPEVAV